MKILFINGSPNKNGNTKALADKMLQGKDYETLNLTEYKIGCYGQNFADDQLDEVIGKMKEADVIGFVHKHDVPVVKSPCPADGHTRREYVKQLLRQLNLENPGVKDRMFTAVQSGLAEWRVHEKQ